ncbi:MAG: V-type ATP synthase subunit E [Euryarchaeota archaeon ADurb.Bin190]|jgi:V/A-type H+-transporting ATPase subunit E|nr:V-type ATP synthase subunit E [Methanothrix sp.]OQB26523.1 MAG: V-type ATP synthase subunit E [Euryarchaeota archaeon ADurb.Bin190]HNU38927.1 V-type ATP synthase subunit E [Methanothrix sp.]HPA97451.1 V-type ATP synthase subunit E [Methanothrix sp.]HPM26265.1 V-type ATP synthase subunit E [Methanothrix sp.]
MALDAVVEAVLATSKDKVAQITGEADQEVARILNEARERAAEIKSRKEAEVGHTVEAIERREISSANLEVKRSELNVHKDLLEQARVKLLGKLENLPKKDNEAMLTKLLEPYDLKAMKVFSNKRDEAFISSLAPNYGGNLDIIGGAVVESSDGALRYDLTYETLAREVFSSRMKEVSRILFG